MATTIIKSRFIANLGTIAAINTPLSFGVGDMTGASNGILWIQASGGAVTTPTWVLSASLDQGVSWFVITGIAATLTGLATGDTASLFASSYNVSGLSGALFHVALTAGTAITPITVLANIS
jgi:hypothetical protein